MEKTELRGEKKLIELRSLAEKEKHTMRMEELKYSRESDLFHHEREKERGRIKSAEIRKSQMRRQGADAFKY